MATIGEVSLSPIRRYDIEWKIKDFFVFSEVVPKYYSSPSFCFAGETWHFVISLREDEDATFGVYLVRSSSGAPISLELAFSLKTPNGKKYEREYTYIFKHKQKSCGEYEYLSRSALLSRRSELVPLGILTIVATLKYPESNLDESEIFKLGPSTARHENKVLHDFKQLFLQKEDCDVIIKVQGKEFPAHKTILKARSPVLASTFRNEMKEKATGIVDIEDCDPSSFSDFLCFLYCGDVGIVSKENVFSLFTAADKYDVQDLRAKCLEFINKILSVDTFCDTITLALQHSETELIKSTTDFFTKNAASIIVTIKWQLFLAENPTQSNELLIKLLAPGRI